ncbi:LOW QUALITY PROTEIN: protein DEK [Pseudochaenichthys georgianus]|uniref:LOW QUALITY PROTEIN: protein DEK n=1 Tax=Pseudochaenichthys georgianus TaxID=52239 RepID=UPI00146D7AEF|nr:LOW QUALITY PROTEIN: protein DEK-like [Pseudochaenichthys georgianus]
MSVAADESLSEEEEEEEVEDQQEAAQEDKSSPDKSSSKISAAGEIIEGKRAKKTVERLDFQAPKQKEKLKIGDGSGDKLGDIPRTCLQITKMKPADLKPLHTILFDRPGKTAILKKNLRLFNGFPFAADSEEFTKKREKLLKNSNFTNTKLKVVCGVLDLEKKGNHSDLVDRILTFLTEPKNSGKRLPVKKKRKSKKRLSGDDSKASAKKSKPKIRSSSSSPKKTKAGSKSKAIVMDSSSDEDDEEEEEKAATTSADDEEEEKAAKESETEEKPSEEREDQSDKSEESEEEESPKSKPARGKSTPKKSAPVKRQRTPAKKTSPPKKRAKKEVSDESDADSEADEKPKKKAAKPAAKTKKADSSSNIKTNTNTGNSSDDDEPLIKMIKKAPSDEQLKETVQSLLKEADLEQMTMKQICQRVFDTYPEHNLANKKDYIKQTVKSLIT